MEHSNEGLVCMKVKNMVGIFNLITSRKGFAAIYTVNTLFE